MFKGALALLMLLCPGAALPAYALEDDVLVTVSDTASLEKAVRRANRLGRVQILLSDGRYPLERALAITGDHVTLRSASGDPRKVVLHGIGMRRTPSVQNLVEVSGQHVALIGLTLQDTPNHLVQLRGERNADHFSLVNCVLRDAYEQLFKVSSEPDAEPSADFGEVLDSTFEYTAGVGPNYYIGGIDLHSGKGWTIAGNVFRNIASPGDRVAEHAIHLWKGSAANIVRDNLIVDSDRGIGFGLGEDWHRHNQGGEIVNNIIIDRRLGAPAADVGIGLENSPDTLVIGNFVYLAHGYPNAIEYRFPRTSNVLISDNLTNKAIVGRNDASAEVDGNRAGSLLTRSLDLAAMATSRMIAWLSSSSD